MRVGWIRCFCIFGCERYGIRPDYDELLQGLAGISDERFWTVVATRREQAWVILIECPDDKTGKR